MVGRRTRNCVGKGSSRVLAGAARALATTRDPRVGEGTERHLRLEWLQNPPRHEEEAERGGSG